jgi:hypothetical protein
MILSNKLIKGNYRETRNRFDLDRYDDASDGAIQQQDVLRIQRHSYRKLDNEQLRTNDVLRIKRSRLWTDAALERRHNRDL